MDTVKPPRQPMNSKDAGGTCMIVWILPGMKEQDIHSEE